MNLPPFHLAFPVDDLYGKVDVPLVLLEAIALGKPVIVVSGGPLVEIACARVVPPNDDAGLAREIAALAADETLRAELGKCGEALHRARFSPEAVAKAYSALYAEKC